MSFYKKVGEFSIHDYPNMGNREDGTEVYYGLKLKVYNNNRDLIAETLGTAWFDSPRDSLGYKAEIEEAIADMDFDKLKLASDAIDFFEIDGRIYSRAKMDTVLAEISCKETRPTEFGTCSFTDMSVSADGVSIYIEVCEAPKDGSSPEYYPANAMWDSELGIFAINKYHEQHG